MLTTLILALGPLPPQASPQPFELLAPLPPQPSGEPIYLVHDRTAGTYTPDPRVYGGEFAAMGAGPSTEVTTLDNTNVNDYYQPLGGIYEAVIDHGRTVGSSGLVCEYSFSYFTQADTPEESGSPLLVMAFYSGDANTIGDCAGSNYGGTGIGSKVYQVGFLGLPGDQIVGDGMGTSYVIREDLSGVQGGGFWLPEGGVSWSYRFETTDRA